MGNAVSATAADERKAQRKQERRQKRERRRQKLLKKQKRQHDEKGNPILLDERGEQYYFDNKGRAYYINEKGSKYYVDDSGNTYYLDEKDEPFYLDENGKKFFLDQNKEPYYINQQGRKYCLDTDGRKYYFGEDGEPYLAVDNSDDDIGDDVSNNFKQKRMGVLSSSSTRSISSKFNEQETGIRSPVTPFREKTDKSENSLQIIDHRQISSGNKTESPPFSSVNSGRADTTESRRTVQVYDHRSRSDRSSNSLPGTDGQSEELLHFTQSDHPDVLPVTPDYVKDETKVSDTSRTAQIEAENKILKKLLQSERTRAPIPAPKSFCKVGVFNIKLKDDLKDCSIVGQGFLSNGNLVIADSNNKKLKLFDPELEYSASYNIEYGPQGLCTGTTDNLVHVTFKSMMHNGINVLKIDDKSISSQQTVKIKGVPYGIARSNVAIAIIVSGLNGWQINLTDFNGKLFKAIKLNNIQSNLATPEYIAITCNIKLLLSDWGSNTVFEINLQGEEILQYNQLREPRGMCTDDNGSIYITSPGVVHQISESGERIKALMRRETTGFTQSGICYDMQDGLLVLTGKSNNIVAFELTE